MNALKFKFFIPLFIICGTCFDSFAQSTFFDFKTPLSGFNTRSFTKKITGKTRVVNPDIAGNSYAGISKRTTTDFITAGYFVPSVNLNTGRTVTEGGTVAIQSGQLHVNAPGTTSDTQISMTVTTAVTKGRLFLDPNGNNIFDSGDTDLGLNTTFTMQDIDDARLKYTSTDDAGTSDSFVFSVTSLGQTITNQTFSITITAVNDAPVITGMPTDITVYQNIASKVNLSAATLSDADAAANNITLTIAAAAGTLSASDNGGVTVSGSGTGTIVLTGTVSALDTYINTASAIKYTGSGLGDNATTLTVTLNDAGHSGSGGAKQIVKIVNVDIFAPTTITSFTPLSGAVGSSVTIIGTAFNTTASNNIVYFGGVKATVTGTPTTTSLTVTVPSGATYSPISVLNTASGLVGYSSKPFLTTFSSNKTGFITGDLAAPYNVSTFQAEEGVASGDFNGDGKPDLMKANYNGVSVYQNFSTSGVIDASSFPTKVDLLPTGTHPSYAAVGDLDNDGKLDIVVSNSTDNMIVLYRNIYSTGAISASSFAAGISFTAGTTSPRNIAIRDLDGDGKPEIITAGESGQISIFQNTSTPGAIDASSFAAKVDLATDVGPFSIALGDLNSDEKPDIVILNRVGEKVTIFQNTAVSGAINTSSFATPIDLAIIGVHLGVAIADIDGDGKPDIIAGGTNGAVFRNIYSSGSLNTGSFDARVNLALPFPTSSVTTGDLNGDGKPDLLFGLDSGTGMSIFANNASSGSISAASFGARADLSFGLTTSVYDALVADMDGDGKPDLVAGNANASAISILRNTLTLSPVTQATNLNFSTTTAVSTTISWTNGNGTGRAVFVKATNSGNPLPVDGTNYTANTAFTSGTQIASTGWYCVYNGTGTTVTVTGLTSGTAYQAMVVEYNGSVTLPVFQTATATGNPATVTTLSTDATLSALTISSGTLSPTFLGSTTSYTASVPNSTTSITLTPTRTEGTATIKVNTVTVASGAASTPINLTVGENTITTAVTAGDGTTTKTYTVTVTRAPSADATLSALALSTGTLNPTFTSATDTYTASVSNATTSIRLTPTRTEGTATIKVNNTTVSSGSASDAIDLNVGSNIITTVVAAGDGTTTKTYTVTVTREASSDATLSAITLSTGTLSPVFTSATDTYTTSVSNASTVITLTPTRTEGTAIIKVNNVTVASGAASESIPLNVGSNTITTVVTAGDGASTKTYTVTITRAASAIANLSAMTISSGTLSPAFASATTSYSASVASSVSSITLTPIVDQADATVKVNGTAVTSGSASGAINLNVGINTITTLVTAQDGTTTKSYTLTVTRPSGVSSVANLAGLSLSSGTLNTTFAAATTAYTVSVPYSTSSLTLTPTAEQANATIKVNGTTVASAAASGSIALNVGTNTISTIVTAQDGTTTKTYTVTVTRAAAATIANLSGLTASAGALDPVFTAATSSYSLFVNNSVSTTTVTPIRDNAGATIKVNGTVVASGTASGSITLAVGSTTITTLVTAEDGTTTKTYTLKITRLAPDQTLPDQSGGATLGNTVNEVVVTSPVTPIIITVPAGTTITPTVAYGDLISNGTGTVPQTTINSPLAKVEIPASTTVTGSNTTWNGTVSAPKISDYEFPKVPGQIITKGLVIEVGSADFSLTFTKAVRLVLYGQAGMRIARVHSGVYTEITTVGTSDTQAAGDALAADGSFKMNAGADLVIWTKGFSQFITFSQDVDLNVALVAADQTELIPDKIRGANADLDHITTVLTNPLPATGSSGSSITWASDRPNVISNDGRTVNRPLLGSGSSTVTMTATLTKGDIAETKAFTLTVLERPNQSPTLTAIANVTPFCYTAATQTVNLAGITAGPESGQMITVTAASSNATLLGPLTITGTGATRTLNFTPSDPLGGTTTITVTVKDNGGTANGGSDTVIRTFTVTVNPLPVIAISSSTGINLSKGLSTTLTASGGVTYSWSNASGIISGQNTAALTVRPAATATYTVTVTNGSGCTSIQSITIAVAEDYKALDLPNILTPNGDGKNDALVIKNLDMYPNHTLKIYDRSGRLIYSKQNYNNDWAGTSDGLPLSEDTYYYILDFGGALGQLKGFVSIVR